jgi:hypothetical protein
VQGRLRNEPLDFDIETECACCARKIRFRMHSDLSFTLEDETSAPVFFVPLVNLTHIKEPSIIDVF